MRLSEVQRMPEIVHAIEWLRSGESTHTVVQRLGAMGIAATAIDGETIRLDECVAVVVEDGEWEMRAGVDAETAAQELLDDEAEYYTDLDRPCVLSVYTAPVLLSADGVRAGKEYGWSRLLQQSEPQCSAGQHEWVNDGPNCGTWAGPHGGVTIIDRCKHCGCTRTLTTLWQYAPDGSLWENVYQYEEEQ